MTQAGRVNHLQNAAFRGSWSILNAGTDKPGRARALRPRLLPLRCSGARGNPAASAPPREPAPQASGARAAARSGPGRPAAGGRPRRPGCKTRRETENPKPGCGRPRASAAPCGAVTRAPRCPRRDPGPRAAPRPAPKRGRAADARGLLCADRRPAGFCAAGPLRASAERTPLLDCARRRCRISAGPAAAAEQDARHSIHQPSPCGPRTGSGATPEARRQGRTAHGAITGPPPVQARSLPPFHARRCEHAEPKLEAAGSAAPPACRPLCTDRASRRASHPAGWQGPPRSARPNRPLRRASFTGASAAAFARTQRPAPLRRARAGSSFPGPLPHRAARAGIGPVGKARASCLLSAP